MEANTPMSDYRIVKYDLDGQTSYRIQESETHSAVRMLSVQPHPVKLEADSVAELRDLLCAIYTALSRPVIPYSEMTFDSEACAYRFKKPSQAPKEVSVCGSV